MTIGWRACLYAIVLLLAGPGATGQQTAPSAAAPWTHDYLARLQAQTLLMTLTVQLLRDDSATVTLEHWCAVHHLASPAQIVAEPFAGTEQAPSPEQRRELAVGPEDPVRYRHVRLRCGALTLSEAQNWYVPARLTSEMNHALDTTETPFGRVVRPLHFRRQTLASELLWQPLPPNWEIEPGVAAREDASEPVPAQVLQLRALLLLPDGTPISEVIETYTRGVLAFPPPSP